MKSRLNWTVSIKLALQLKREKCFTIFLAMSKAQRIQKTSLFTSGGKFSVSTLSYVNTAFNQSAFRIHKCYIIMKSRLNWAATETGYIDLALQLMHSNSPMKITLIFPSKLFSSFRSRRMPKSGRQNQTKDILKAN